MQDGRIKVSSSVLALHIRKNAEEKEDQHQHSYVCSISLTFPGGFQCSRLEYNLLPEFSEP